MAEIFGRANEIEILQESLTSDKSEFVALTGRRRIGKTFLVKQFFEAQICFYITGVQDGDTNTQLKIFNNEINNRTAKRRNIPNDWIEAFALLRQYIKSIKVKKGEKKVIFLDELPWIHTQRSNFLQLLAHFWNDWAQWEKNIILVVCGSATSWIVKNIFNDKGGLHNRVTKRIHLAPFTLHDTQVFLQSKKINLSEYDIAQLYMVMGGVPFYLNEIKKGTSLAQNIQRICFNKQGLLRNEFDNLYQSLFHLPERHIAVVKALAGNTYGLQRNELLIKAKMHNNGASTKLLDELILSGFIDYYVPYGNRKKEGKYVLVDFYTKFYLKFIAGKNEVNWSSIINTNAWKIWSGLAFELLCHQHLFAIKNALGISGINTQTSFVYLYNDQRKNIGQIDLLIDRDDNTINICEIKFSTNTYTITKSESEKVLEKRNQFLFQNKIRKSTQITYITTFGCKQSGYVILDNEVVLSDLFKP